MLPLQVVYHVSDIEEHRHYQHKYYIVVYHVSDIEERKKGQTKLTVVVYHVSDIEDRLLYFVALF